MPGLNLKGKAVLPSDDDVRIKKTANSIIDDVDNQVRELGLPDYPHPSGVPKSLVGLDVSNMHNNDLGQLYVEYTAFAQYVLGQLARIKAAYNISLSNLKHIDAKLRIEMVKDDVSKAEIPSRIKDHPLYTEFNIEVMKLYAMKSLLEAHYKAYTKQAAALSRIVSLRVMEFDQSERERGILGMKKGKPARPSIDLTGKPVRVDP